MLLSLATAALRKTLAASSSSRPKTEMMLLLGREREE
jgi:hypothetical protein